MQIEFVGRHVGVDAALKRLAEEKLAKATKRLADPIEVHVTFESERHRKIVEVRVQHRDGALHAREVNAELGEAIHLAADAIAAQATRSLKKAVDRRRRAGRAAAAKEHWPVEVLARASVGGGRVPRILKSSRFPIKPMSLEEAALLLEDSTNDFVVFRDSETERVSVLYKRRDEDYGLIAPEV